METRWLRVTGDGLPPLHARTAGSLFDFSARRWTAEDLENARRPTDLHPGGRVWLNLDHAQQGLGSASCGPALPERYRVPVQPTTFGIRHAATTNGEDPPQWGVADPPGCPADAGASVPPVFVAPEVRRRVPDLLPCAVDRDERLELVEESEHRIATGFVGTPIVSDALTSTGHVDAAYDLGGAPDAVRARGDRVDPGR